MRHRLVGVPLAALALLVTTLHAQAAQPDRTGVADLPALSTEVQMVGALGVRVIPIAASSGDGTLNLTYDWGDGSATTTSRSTGLHTYQTFGTYTITSTLSDAAGDTESVQDTFTTDGARFVAFGPKRLLDTRTGNGTGGVVASVRAGGTVALQVAGVGGIPADARAVVLNVTVTNPRTAGNVRAYPAGAAEPGVSTVNFVAGQTVPNATVVSVGAGGVVDLSVAGGPVDLVADATGYFVGDEAADGYTMMTDTRVLDTRSGVGTGGRVGPVASNATLGFQIGGVAGVPTSGLTAVALNLTVTGPTAAGVITAFPDGAPRPVASNVNFVQGQTVANLAIVPVGADGRVDLVNASPGTTHLVADVVGYFATGEGNTYVPLTPYRALDTRKGTAIGARSQTLASSQILGVPTAGFVLNVTVTNTHASGFVLVGPQPLPAGLAQRASTVNWTGAGQTAANLAIPSSTNAIMTVVNVSDGATDVIGDVAGYFEPAGAAASSNVDGARR